MTKNGRIIYTAHAHVTGGRAAGHGRTSDGALEVDLRAPLELGGAFLDTYVAADPPRHEGRGAARLVGPVHHPPHEKEVAHVRNHAQPVG